MRRPAEFSFRTRARNLETLARETFDVLVVGGGITGAGIARDAALRGLRVALVERRDFAVGTSSRSSKLIHGGLRYLAQGDVGLVMEAANERRAVRRMVPHLARPIQMLLPVHSRAGYATIRAGLWTYDRMARVLKEERNHMLGRDEALALEPGLRADRVYGAGLYYEYLTDDARLVLANIRSAAGLGAVIANYAEVTALLAEGGRLRGAVVRDRVADGEFPVRARVVVNAAGPWVDAVRMLQSDHEKPRLHLAEGIHVIVRRERLPVSRIVVMSTPDKRNVFAVPQGEIVYLGTTDTEYEGRLDDPDISLADVEYLLGAANATFTFERLGLDDVVGAWSGLRPLLHQEGKRTTEISRKDEVMIGPTGLLSIAGGKLTTFRKMAERVMEIAGRQLNELGVPLPPRDAALEAEPLCGGDTGEDVAAFAQRLKQRWPSVAEDIVDRLVPLYGGEAERMVEAMAGDLELATRCASGSALTRAEIAHVCRDEMVVTLEDVLERRTRSFLWDPYNGLPVSAEVAAQVGRFMGWNTATVAAEIAAYQMHVRDVKTFAPGPGGSQVATA